MLATESSFALPQSIRWQYLHDFQLICEQEIAQAMIWMIEQAHTLAESAGAAVLAGAYKQRSKLRAKKLPLSVQVAMCHSTS
jgi:threonine dehydratase